MGIVAVGVIAVAIFAVHSMRGDRHKINTWSRYYTCDDGKTLFEDDAPHVAPFDHDGHEAVEAYLIPGRDPGPESVWYLAKWSDEGKQIMEGSNASPGAGKPLPADARLVKRPGMRRGYPATIPKQPTF